jgi:DNA polymerase III delta subunit
MTPGAGVSRIGYLEYVAAPPRDVPPLVIIAGNEHLLGDEVLRRIVETVVPDESLRPLNVDTIDAAVTGDFEVLGEKLNALPFLAEQRVVTVRGVAELHNDDRIALRDAIPETFEQSVLIIDDAGVPRPQRGKAPKDKVDSAGFAAGRGRALLVNTSLDGPQRERYIERHAQAIGVTIDAGARRYLAAFESVDEIRNALDRLALVAKKITKAAAEEYVKPPGDPKLWDLGNAVGRGDLNAALRLAHEIVGKPEDAPGPLIWLAGDAQIAWELACGATPNNWAAATGQSPFRAMKLWDVARKRTAQQARDIVRLTMRALEDSLTGKRAPDQALEEIIIRLCGQR